MRCAAKSSGNCLGVPMDGENGSLTTINPPRRQDRGFLIRRQSGGGESSKTLVVFFGQLRTRQLEGVLRVVRAVQTRFVHRRSSVSLFVCLMAPLRLCAPQSRT